VKTEALVTKDGAKMTLLPEVENKLAHSNVQVLLPEDFQAKVSAEERHKGTAIHNSLTNALKELE